MPRGVPPGIWENRMAFKPNYNQQRSERNRLKEQKKQEKLQRREEEVQKRRAARDEPGEGQGTDVAGPAEDAVPGS